MVSYCLTLSQRTLEEEGLWALSAKSAIRRPWWMKNGLNMCTNHWEYATLELWGSAQPINLTQNTSSRIEGLGGLFVVLRQGFKPGSNASTEYSRSPFDGSGYMCPGGRIMDMQSDACTEYYLYVDCREAQLICILRAPHFIYVRIEEIL